MLWDCWLWLYFFGVLNIELCYVSVEFVCVVLCGMFVVGGFGCCLCVVCCGFGSVFVELVLWML